MIELTKGFRLIHHFCKTLILEKSKELWQFNGPPLFLNCCASVWDFTFEILKKGITSYKMSSFFLPSTCFMWLATAKQHKLLRWKPYSKWKSWKKLISWNILLVMKYSFGMNCNKQTIIHSKTAVNKSLLLPDCQKSHTTQIDMEKSINVSEGWISGRLGLVWISISDICKPSGSL